MLDVEAPGEFVVHKEADSSGLASDQK
jgi:hypothetical protein